MKKLFYILPVFLAAFVFAGCKRNNDINISDGNAAGGYVRCTAEDKAVENCNMVYYPVCGDDGETYGNACVACSSQKINSYKMGECGCNDEDGICSVSNDVIQSEINNEGEITEQEEIPEIVIDVPVPNF